MSDEERKAAEQLRKKNLSVKGLRKILSDINNGGKYIGISKGRGTGIIFRTPYGNIGWNHYGESACPSTIRGLKFILEVIFNDCECFVPAIWSDYHVNYIPADTRFRAVDLSAKHPNICGL